MKELTSKETSLAAEFPLTKRAIYELAVQYADMHVAVEEKNFLGDNC